MKKLTFITLIVIVFVLIIGLTSACNLMCLGQDQICENGRCIYISKQLEPDFLGINETAPYWYLTSEPNKGKNCVPTRNYLKIRYSDESLFYVRWDLEKIDILYSSQDWFDNLASDSKIRFGNYRNVGIDSLERYYKRYQL